jgi:alcohol dehydrogenase class IV
MHALAHPLLCACTMRTAAHAVLMPYVLHANRFCDRGAAGGASAVTWWLWKMLAFAGFMDWLLALRSQLASRAILQRLESMILRRH